MCSSQPPRLKLSSVLSESEADVCGSLPGHGGARRSPGSLAPPEGRSPGARAPSPGDAGLQETPTKFESQRSLFRSLMQGKAGPIVRLEASQHLQALGVLVREQQSHRTGGLTRRGCSEGLARAFSGFWGAFFGSLYYMVSLFLPFGGEVAGVPGPWS